MVGENNKIKFIDFGFSDIYENYQAINQCGALGYMCPQLLKKKVYNPFKADIWALGVLIF